MYCLFRFPSFCKFVCVRFFIVQFCETLGRKRFTLIHLFPFCSLIILIIRVKLCRWIFIPQFSACSALLITVSSNFSGKPTSMLRYLHDMSDWQSLFKLLWPILLKLEHGLGWFLFIYCYLLLLFIYLIMSGNRKTHQSFILQELVFKLIVSEIWRNFLRLGFPRWISGLLDVNLYWFFKK